MPAPADREAAETLARAREHNLPDEAVTWKCVVCARGFPHRMCATCHAPIHKQCFGKQRITAEREGDEGEGLECPSCVRQLGGDPVTPQVPFDNEEPTYRPEPRSGGPPPGPARSCDNLEAVKSFGSIWDEMKVPDPLPESLEWRRLTLLQRFEDQG